MKYCPSCGKSYNKNANFCEECGTQLKEINIVKDAVIASEESEDVIVVSSNHIPGYEIVETIGFVYGLTVRSRGLGGQIAAFLRSLIGGEIKEYITMMEHSRQEALERLIEHARNMGANAVISTRFDSSEISNVMQEILAYGTAVKVKKKEKEENVSVNI